MTEDGNQHFKEDEEESEVDDDYPHPTQVLSATPRPLPPGTRQEEKAPRSGRKGNDGIPILKQQCPARGCIRHLFQVDLFDSEDTSAHSPGPAAISNHGTGLQV